MMEEWTVSPQAGDCNDYSVTKRHEMLARGWPSSALLLSEVVTPKGEHHLVLVARLEEDDLVLDNLNNDVRPVGSTRYRWVRAQSPTNPRSWSEVRITRASTPQRHLVLRGR
jgi:predicted transglutaminase-like cysteine proteinase